MRSNRKPIKPFSSNLYKSDIPLLIISELYFGQSNVRRVVRYNLYSLLLFGFKPIVSDNSSILLIAIVLLTLELHSIIDFTVIYFLHLCISILHEST